jgi:nitrite reductase (NADH) small subunit
MLQAASNQQTTTQWTTVCSLEQILPNTGVCALVKGEQVAIFRIGNSSEIYAVSNYDPFSKTYVLSRGIVGDRNGIVKVASPIYKQNFNLKTGQCLDNEAVSVPTWTSRVVEGKVQINVKH